MAKQSCKKVAWVIKNFSSLESEKCYSVPVLIGDCKWRLRAYPKGHGVADYLSVFLELVDYESLPSGWRGYVKYRLTIANHGRKKILMHSHSKESNRWFDKVTWNWGFSMIPLTKLHDKDAGYLENDEVTIIAEVDVLEVIDTLDASEKSKEEIRPLKKKKLNDGVVESNVQLKADSSINRKHGCEWVSSSFFTDSVKRIFRRHPDIAVDFCAKNQYLRTTCINFLLNLVETLCKSLQELSNEDFVDADIALTYLKEVKFKVDWLEKKLDDVKEKKKKEQSALAQLQETEENILKLKQKFSELEAELSTTRNPLSFDDVV